MSTVYLSFRHWMPTVYYILPHWKFPQAFGTQGFKHRHQEVITKVDETVTCKFIYGQAIVRGIPRHFLAARTKSGWYLSEGRQTQWLWSEIHFLSRISCSLSTQANCAFQQCLNFLSDTQDTVARTAVSLQYCWWDHCIILYSLLMGARAWVWQLWQGNNDISWCLVYSSLFRNVSIDVLLFSFQVTWDNYTYKGVTIQSLTFYISWCKIPVLPVHFQCQSECLCKQA